MDEKFLTQAQAKAAKYCSMRERAPKQVLDKLIGWDIPIEEAEKILHNLLQEQFINEERFARAFCHDKFEFNSWGRIRIKMEISRYGLSKDVVEDALYAIKEPIYEDRACTLAKRKWESLRNESDDWKRRQKTMAYLLRKGFETDLVRKVTHKVSSSEHLE